MDYPAEAHRDPEIVKVGRYYVHLSTKEVFCGQQPVILSWRSYEAFKLLVDAGGEVVDRKTLFEKLWPDVAVGESSLNQCITKLRKELGEPSEAGIIETVARRGYRVSAAPELVLPGSESVEPGKTAVVPGSADLSQPLSGRKLSHLWLLSALLLVTGMLSSGIAYTWSHDSRDSQAKSLTEEGFRLVRENRTSAISQASNLFRQALDLNSSFAPAQAGLAEVMARSGNSAPGQSGAMAERAVRLDPRCIQCKAIAGWILMVREWRFRDAERYLNEAVALAPDDARILLWHAQMLACSGRLREALAEIDRARSLDFKQPAVVTMRAGILYLSGRYTEAINDAHEALSLQPAYASAFEWIYRSSLRLDRVDEAIAAKAAVNSAYLGLTSDSRFQMEGRWAGVYRQNGPRSLVEALLGETSAKPALDHQRYDRATWRIWNGDQQGALDELEHVFDFRPFNSIYLAVDPMFAPIRKEQRFRNLLSRIGLTAIVGLDN
jgi:DNA-binding winged helix-turn-helix (wHTH) protein/tetratricopeptide (TPR) repeat protein